MTLTIDFNLGKESDDLYATLLDAHHDLTAEQSAALNTRLVLILMNHVGNAAIIREAIAAARRDGPQQALG